MAGFIDVRMAPVQFKRALGGGRGGLVCMRSKCYTVSKSIHYGAFLCFEGIRFFVREEDGAPAAVFLNLDHNLQRFRRSMAFYLSPEQEETIPSADELRDMVARYLGSRKMREFIAGMIADRRYGYLRPYTLDEGLSIGVDFPSEPTIRIAAASFAGYLGEPFSGVVVPNIVRAVESNGTGALKLGINYPVSIRAIRLAREHDPDAKAALLLDDRTWLPTRERLVTEWDSSCCMFGLSDGTVVTIPDGPLILPSVTVRGLRAVLKDMGVNVLTEDVSYGKLLDGFGGRLSTVCSVGTAGVLNRTERLTMVLGQRAVKIHEVNKKAEVYHTLGQARERYLSLYTSRERPPEDITRDILAL